MTRLKELTAAAVLVLLAPAAPAQSIAVGGARPTATTNGNFTVAESAGRLLIPVRLPRATLKSYVINWSITGGTATPGLDVAKSGKVTVKKGARRVSIPIKLIDDKLAEGTETFGVALKARGLRVKPSRVAVTLLDDGSDTGQGGNQPTPTQGATALPTHEQGTLKFTESGPTQGGSFTWTITLTADLSPSATPGDWLDNGTGRWTVTGSATSVDYCRVETTYSGSGTFYTQPPTPGQSSETGRGRLVLHNFYPANATGTPSIELGVNGVALNAFYPTPDNPACGGGAGQPMTFVPTADAQPNFFVPAQVTGATPLTRGIRLVYSDNVPTGRTQSEGSLNP